MTAQQQADQTDSNRTKFHVPVLRFNPADNEGTIGLCIYYDYSSQPA